MELNLKEQLNQKPMNLFQWFTISVCIFLNIIDGFDVMVMAFTATSVAAEWGLNGSQLGALLSAGLFGMAFGSLLLAPQADKIGRRPLILICLLIAGISMVASSMAHTAFALGMMRFMTGLGIGGILASSNVIASEYASNQWRSLSVSLQSTGYAIGATVGGLIALYLIRAFSWHAVFLAGGLGTLAMLLVAYFALPESLDYLLVKRPPHALKKINALAPRLGLSPLSAMPEPLIHIHPKNNVSLLFTPIMRLQTLYLWLCFFLVMFGFYFVMSWTPKILSSTGLSNEQGVTAGVLLSAGGIFGAALIGLISSKIRIFYVQAAFMAVTAILIFAFVNNTTSLGIALLLGIMVNGCVAGLYAMSPSIYQTEVRATGVGYAISFGRVGAIISPLFAGVFLDFGISPTTLYCYYALAFVLAIIAVLSLSKSNHARLNSAIHSTYN